MGLVKCVLRELHHLVKYLICHGLRDSICHTSRNILHLLRLLLRHGSAHKVTSSQRIARQLHNDLHYLLLVNDTSVSRLKYLLKLRGIIVNQLTVLLAPDVVVYELHRTRSKQSNTGNYIVQTLRLQLHHEVSHALTFELEHTLGLSLSHESKYIRIIVIYIVYVYILACCLLDQLDCILHNSRRTESQEVHLEHSQMLHRVLLKLGYHRALGSD